ncbi:hypothetical protein D1871_22995 [Nakamurella silvestris]|nr:hypothetical protein D1871_22995 [Nakamurella silvestris]
MSHRTLEELNEHLQDRDHAILNDLERFRLLTSRQIQRLHFHDGHQTTSAAARASTRVLTRLAGHGLIAHLERRIGGVRRGSAGFIWHLGPSGERLLRKLKGLPARRRYVEPSARFVSHTIGIAELALQLIEADRLHLLGLLSVETEPSTWRTHLSPHGATEWLKPDLYLVTAAGPFEDHWFIEYDQATEHLPVVLRQCQAYQRHFVSGRHQAAHGLFPAVLWVTTNPARADAITRAIATDKTLNPDLFHVTTTERFLGWIAAGPPVGAPTEP